MTDATPHNGQNLHFTAEELGGGWRSWDLRDATRFNSAIEPLMVRVDPPTEDGRPRARVRMLPERKHSNLGDKVHGATLLSLIDISLFTACHQFGSLSATSSVTLDLSTQFVGAGRLDEPLDAVVELVRQTKRLIFLRGLVMQDENDSHIVASFSGTIRKGSEQHSNLP